MVYISRIIQYKHKFELVHLTFVSLSNIVIMSPAVNSCSLNNKLVLRCEGDTRPPGANAAEHGGDANSRRGFSDVLNRRAPKIADRRDAEMDPRMLEIETLEFARNSFAFL